MSIEDTTASPAAENPEALDATTAEASPDANTAQSSSADETDAKQAAPEDLDSIIRKAVQKEPEPEEDSSTPEAEAEEAEPEAKAEEDADPDADVPFHKHPRWQEMKAERDSFKADAETYRSMTSFMQQSNLSSEEVASGFDIMALMKSATMGNLEHARQMFDWAAQVQAAYGEMLGEQLPDDLRQKVEDGLVDEDVAKELSRERAKARTLENLRTQEEERANQTREQEAAQARQTEMANAVEAWEAEIRAKDADYATKKAKLVETQTRALMQQRGAPPANVEEAVSLVKQAYAEVNEMLKPLMPKPRPMTPSPTGMSARVTTEPKSFAEAIRSAVNR